MTMGKMKRYCCAGVLLLLFILGAIDPACAGDDRFSPWRDPEKLLSYADELMQKGESWQAATEYKRFLSLYPGHRDALEVEMRLGFAYCMSGDWKRAIEAFYGLAALNEEENRLSARAMFHLAETYSREGLHKDALQEYAGFLKRYPDDPLVPEARYGAGWAMMALGDGEGASAQFSHLDRSSPLYPEPAEGPGAGAVFSSAFGYSAPFLSGGRNIVGHFAGSRAGIRRPASECLGFFYY